MRDKEKKREKNKLLHKILFQIKTIICAFLHGQSNNLEFRGMQRKGKFRGWEVKKRTLLWGVGIPHGGAKRPVIRPDISHADNNTLQTRNDIEVSLSFFLAAINASARTCNFERLPRPTRWPVMPRQFVRNPTMPTFLPGQWNFSRDIQ